jgi:urea transport system permease protein
MSAVLPTPSFEAPTRMLSMKSWFGVFAALLVVLVVAPVLNLVVPEGSILHMSDYAVALVGKIMCYAICALAMDLIWGYTGILSLGHGVFFALGGYAMGMYLMRQIGTDGQYKSEMPDFMVFLNWKEYPWHWALSDSFIAQMLFVVLVPGLLAFVFGFFAFRSRIKGVYFSIITQAMTSPPCCCSSATRPASAATTDSPTSSASSASRSPRPRCA